jgi:lycopene cyclase domain-containing protein
MKSLYFLILLGTVCVPFLFSFHSKIRFDKTFKSFFTANAIVALLFVLWDLRFTQLGIWGFNPHYVSGLFVFNLPIEEILFFVCIPFSCVFTYHCLTRFYAFTWKPKTENTIIITLAIVLFVLGLTFFQQAYPAVTFISLSVILILLKFVANVNWIGKLLSIYPVLLIPFFIVNGLLTGTGLDQPVVWYDDAENMGIRLLTIPLEDVFYGFELILLNIFVYEWLLGLKSGDER